MMDLVLVQRQKLADTLKTNQSFAVHGIGREPDRRGAVAIHELSYRPAELLARYRTLCEASGIARASRVPLAPRAQAELADLQRQLVALLDDEPATPSVTRVPPLLRDQASAPPASTAPPTPISHPSDKPANPAPEPPAQPADASATVFTDGAAEGNPGPGGYCAIVRIPGRPERELSGSSIHTTNNKMELSAALAGLRAVVDADIPKVTVFSDSEYLVKGMTEWLPDWQRRGWKTASGQPVKNQDLWQQLAALSQGREIQWRWVKGHAGHPENERCDTVATAAARRAARARPV